MTKARLMAMLNDMYGTNIAERFSKLQEEFSELEQVYDEIRQVDMSVTGMEEIAMRKSLRNLVAHFKDELADVNVIIFHIAGILNTNQSKLLHHAERKILGRKKNLNFMRFWNQPKPPSA